MEQEHFKYRPEQNFVPTRNKNEYLSSGGWPAGNEQQATRKTRDVLPRTPEVNESERASSSEYRLALKLAS